MTFFHTILRYVCSIDKEWLLLDCLLFISVFLYRYKIKREHFLDSVVFSLVPAYYFLILSLTVLSRNMISDGKPVVELMPFWTYFVGIHESGYVWVDIKYNVLLFIPLGLFLELSFKSIKLFRVAIIGVIGSLFIEILQLVTCRGTFETDDIIHNTIGIIIGYVLCRFMLEIKKYLVNVKNKSLNK